MTLNYRRSAWLSTVFLRVNLLFRKFVGCGGPKLTGGASGRGVLRGTFGPGQKKKKKKKKKKKRKRKPWA